MCKCLERFTTNTQPIYDLSSVSYLQNLQQKVRLNKCSATPSSIVMYLHPSHSFSKSIGVNST